VKITIQPGKDESVGGVQARKATGTSLSTSLGVSSESWLGQPFSSVKLGHARIAGSGSKANAYWVHDEESKQLIVVKHYKKSEAVSRKFDKESILNELLCLRAVPPHPNLCQFYGAKETRQSIYFYLEDCGRRKLDEYTKNSKMRMSETWARMISVQILQAMEALHKLNMYHNDLSNKNILISDSLKVKVIDFGNMASGNSVQVITTNVLSAFSSYERLLHLETTPEAEDVWSLGVNIFYLFFKKYPFGMAPKQFFEESRANLAENFIPDYPATSQSSPPPSPLLLDLFSKIFRRYQDRITMDELMKHKWFKLSV